MPEPLKILVFEYVTGGGMSGFPLEPAWLKEGLEMRNQAIRGFQDSGCDVITLSDCRLDQPIETRWVNIATQESLNKTLLELSFQTDHAVIIAPETDNILAGFAAHGKSKPNWNLGCHLEEILLCSDKYELSKHFHRKGIRHPKTFGMNDPSVQNCLSENGLVLKPRDGAGSLDTYFIASGSPIPVNIKTSQERFICQPQIPGQSMSLSVLADGQGNFHPIGVCSHQSEFEELFTGIKQLTASEGRMEPDFPVASLRNSWMALKSLPKLRGWVGVDLIWNPESQFDTVIEINPRLTMGFCWISSRIPVKETVTKWLEILSENMNNG